jgi:hypothetical protein
MSSVRILNELTSSIYCLAFTVKNWHYIFDRHNRFQILADSEKPVRRQYVKKPGDWLWSSANPESDIVIESVVL